MVAMFWALLVGCGTEEVTWYDDVAPIAAARCAGCHQPGAIAGFLDLTDGPSAVAWATAIEAAVAEGRMPPFPADGGDCEPPGGFREDPRLSDSERDTVLTWVSTGALLGEPTPTPPVSAPEGLASPSAVLYPTDAIRVPSSFEAPDSFVCVLLDPELDDTVWLDGFHVEPDDSEVVHHVLVNRVSRAAALERDAEDGALDGVYPCFSGVEIEGSTLVAAWIPGGSPLEYPEGSGTPLQPDEILVTQMHYHGVAEDRFDRSGLAVRWQSEAPEVPALLNLVGNARSASDGLLPGPADDGFTEFRIPAGAVGHSETSEHLLPVPPQRTARPFMIAPHMHLVGRGMTVWLEREDGTRDCVVDVPAYDFDWQLFYLLDPEQEGLHAEAGDKLRIECRYDNTPANPSVAAALAEVGLEAPIDVGIGNGTLDEMCLVGIGSVLTQ